MKSIGWIITSIFSVAWSSGNSKYLVWKWARLWWGIVFFLRAVRLVKSIDQKYSRLFLGQKLIEHAWYTYSSYQREVYLIKMFNGFWVPKVVHYWNFLWIRLHAATQGRGLWRDKKTTDNGPPRVLKWFEKSGPFYFRVLQKRASNSVEILEGFGSQFSQPLSSLLPTILTE